MFVPYPYIFISQFNIEYTAFSSSILIGTHGSFAGNTDLDCPTTHIRIQRNKRTHPTRHSKSRRSRTENPLNQINNYKINLNPKFSEFKKSKTTLLT
jgi:hypothetical protein